jgi:Flp pilus assembly protein TadB
MALIDVFMDVARKFARAFVPEGRRVDFERKLLRAGIRHEPYTTMGLYFFVVIAAMLVIYFAYVLRAITGSVLSESVVVIFTLFIVWSFVYVAVFLFAVLVVSWYAFQYFINSKTYQRTKVVEAVLEDYLRYVTENLRGGMPFQQALWNSVKPEFGVLAEEIEIVTKKVVTGTELEVALDEFTEKYDSPMLQRTFDIIAEALQGGGRVTDTLEDIITNLSSLKQLKQELVTTNMSYSIFINAIVIFITPLLFALSTQFIFILNRIGETVGDSLSGGGSGGVGGFGGLSFSGAALSIDEFRMFAMSILIINSLGAVVLTTIMNKGDIRQLSIINVFIYPAISAGIYLLISNAATNLFAGFVPI